MSKGFTTLKCKFCGVTFTTTEIEEPKTEAEAAKILNGPPVECAGNPRALQARHRETTRVHGGTIIEIRFKDHFEFVNPSWPEMRRTNIFDGLTEAEGDSSNDDSPSD